MKPGWGIGSTDLGNDSGEYLVTMAISVDLNHDGWMEGGRGTAEGCNPALPRTTGHRRAHQTLLWSDHSKPVQSPERMFGQYTPALLFLRGKAPGSGLCLTARVTLPFLLPYQAPDSAP